MVWIANMPAASTATRGTFSSLISDLAQRRDNKIKTIAIIQ
jgi:hypothetical protein